MAGRESLVGVAGSWRLLEEAEVSVAGSGRLEAEVGVAGSGSEVGVAGSERGGGHTTSL